MKEIRDRLQWRRRSGHGVHRSSKAEGKRQINHVSGFRDRLPVAIIFATDPERIPKPASVTYKTNSVLPRHKLRSLLNTERRRNSSRGRPVVNPVLRPERILPAFSKKPEREGKSAFYR
jgi:hypothetical protein